MLRTPRIWPALAALALSAAGCAAKPAPQPLRLPAPKPYLLVSAADPAGGAATRVVYLPDWSQSYSVRPKRWTGGGTFHVELTEEGFLKSVVAGHTEGGGAPVPATALADTGQPAEATLSPGLYEILFDASGKPSGLRRVPSGGGLPGSSPGDPARPIAVADLRFDQDPAAPERVTGVSFSLDPFPAGAEICPPPGVSVDVQAGGERLECPLTCDPGTRRAGCAFKHRGYVPYVASARTPAGAADARFPAGVDGYAAFQPKATVAFGTLPDGRVRTIAVEYQPKLGACLRDAGAIRVWAAGTEIDSEQVQKRLQRTGTGCLQGVVLSLAERELSSDVAVTVVPRNDSALEGPMVFAAAAALPPPPEVRPPVVNVTTPDPQVLVLDRQEIAQATPDGSNVNIYFGEGGGKNGPDPARPCDCKQNPPSPSTWVSPAIQRAQARVNAQAISGFDLYIDASPEVIRTMQSPEAVLVEKKGQNRAIAIEAMDCNLQGGKRLAVSMQSVTPVAKDKYQARIFVAPNQLVPDHRIALMIPFKRTDGRGMDCIRVSADESLVRRGGGGTATAATKSPKPTDAAPAPAKTKPQPGSHGGTSKAASPRSDGHL